MLISTNCWVELVSKAQLTPESLDTQIASLRTTAAIVVPSLDEAMPLQFRVVPAPAAFEVAQLLPELCDIHMSPPYTVAASLVPSLDEVIAIHG
jgi:hypothetical protein